MNIIRTSDRATATVYGLQCQPAVEPLFDGKLPFGTMHCVVKPGITSTIHNHHEYECFFITQGSGTLTIGADSATVRAGDVIRIPPFADHTLHNDGQDELHFLTFWWEDLNALLAPAAGAAGSARALIFSTPPTPNGDLHLGHLSGPYTGADIYRRFLELQGATAFHVTGRDDNQSYVPRKALDQGRTPEALADDYSARIQQTLERNAIRVDHYGYPKASPYHNDLTRRVVRELFDKGMIYERDVDALFCASTGNYLYEAHVRGLCPHCQVESDGNACEQCGRPNDVTDLIEPHSKYANGGTTKRQVRKLYFRMSAFADQLRAYHREVTMPAHLAALCHRMLEAGLPDICVSHFSDWGIPVPVAGYDDQRIYVWFEMAAGYLAAAQETAEKAGLCAHAQDGWKQFFAHEHTKVVHFFGFDNGYFHAVLFPAVYMALDWGITPPAAFVVNELLNLEGLKFSTSRGHLIWGRDLLDQVPSDYVRYYLSYVRPETSKTNFTLTEFMDVVNEQLVGTWQNWLGNLVDKTCSAFGAKIPAPGAWAQEHRAYFELVDGMLKQARTAYQAESFSPQRICHLASELVREAKRFSASQTHYAGSAATYDLLRTGIALELLAAKTLAVIIQPIMPAFSDSLWQMLEGQASMQWPATPTFVGDGRVLQAPAQPFFSSVPETVLELWK